MAHIEKATLRRARDLRKDATPQERKLWYKFLWDHPAHFRRQQPIGPYIVDFCCHSACLVLELDGSGHYEPEQYAYDRKREQYLEAQGLRILRFTNLEVDRNFSGVCETINRAIDPTQR